MAGKPVITFDTIDAAIISKWQGIADLLAKIISVPAALIMKTENEHMEVFLSSKTDNNPYHPGDREKWHGLYCETVIKTQKELCVPDATVDLHWSNNPDTKRGMIAYLGYPINFPDKRPFGTLCVLDNKKNTFSLLHRQLLLQLRDMIELDIAVLQNIAERKEAEEKENAFAEIFDSAPNSITIHDTDGNFHFFNQKTLELHGYTRDEFTRMNLHDLDVPESASLIAERFALIDKFGEARFDVAHYRKNGTSFPMEVYVKKIMWQGNPAFISIATDITERKNAEAKLAASEEKYRTIVENIMEALFIHDFKGRILDCNEAACQMTGYSRGELIGQSLSLIDSNENKSLFPERMQRLLRDNVIVFEGSFIRKDGGPVPFEACVKVVSHEMDGIIQGFVRDISDRKHTEELLANTQKLESIGILAGGIAHDFNNLMGGIFGYIDLASYLSKDNTLSDYLNKAMSTIDRARGLTQQLLTFAKGGAPIQKIGRLFPFLQETAQFALSGSNVSCHFDVQENLWACNFDKNQIGQVIDNIIINAQHAMPVGGTIELTARNVTLAEKEHALLKKGDYVKISVIDYGVGIQKELVSKIFDPFFTTKAKGHGLGLAICYSIVKKHEGCIDVESEMGKGSTFHVYLPASTDAALSPKEESETMHRGIGVFLVMDDEEVIRETIRRILTSFGYTVVCKANGNDAVEFFEAETREQRTVAGILFDLTVPGGMGGVDTVKNIRKLNRVS